MVWVGSSREAWGQGNDDIMQGVGGGGGTRQSDQQLFFNDHLANNAVYRLQWELKHVRQAAQTAVTNRASLLWLAH